MQFVNAPPQGAFLDQAGGTVSGGQEVRCLLASVSQPSLINLLEHVLPEWQETKS